MKTRHVNFPEAHKILKGISGKDGSGLAKNKRISESTLHISSAARNADLLARVILFYHENLNKSSSALAYLKKRGIDNIEAINEFKLGFSGRTMGLKLKNKPEIRKRLSEIGVIKSTGFELFSGCLVVPVFDRNGRVVEIYGRRIGATIRKGSSKHLYLPGPNKGIWNRACLTSKEIILCESHFDALTFWVNGLKNVTCSNGINGFTDEMLSAFKVHDLQRLIIAYDRDKAGDQAALRVARQCMSEGIVCYRVQFPHRMDANEYALSTVSASKDLREMVNHALWISGDDRPALSMETYSNHTSKSEIECVPARVLNHEQSSLVAKTMERLYKSEVKHQVQGEEILFSFGEQRVYRVRGFYKNLSIGQLRVNLLVLHNDEFHMDTVDLCQERQRFAFSKRASVLLRLDEQTLQVEMGKILFKLEGMQYENLEKTLNKQDKAVELSEQDKARAMEFLKSPDLLTRILEDFEKCGLVGEETNKLIIYLAAVSRKLLYPLPLAIIIQSSSAAGKTSLMEAVLGFMPPEEQVKYSAMTGQSLFYMEGKSLKHKILAVVEEEGVERASYSLKLLQSEGELTIASTGKDPKTGEIRTKDYHVEGPVMIIITTTAAEIDEELLNRCLILSVDEGQNQTKAIHVKQRQAFTKQGLAERMSENILKTCHQNAQRLLKPVAVVNPFAEALTFKSDQTRMRRDHMKYLTLIQSIALLHQYQRPKKMLTVANGRQQEYIEITLDDIEKANKLAHAVMGSTLDELPPQTRKCLTLIEAMVEETCERLKLEKHEYRFTRKELRSFTHWGNTQLKVHINRLVEFEYLLVFPSGRGQSYVYELVYDGEGKDGSAFLLGLSNIAKLRKTFPNEESRTEVVGENGKRSGQTREKSPPGRPPISPWSGGGRGS